MALADITGEEPLKPRRGGRGAKEQAPVT